MKPTKLSSIVIIVFILLNVGCTNTKHHDLLITNASIIDVKTGEILKNRVVAIDSNRITAIYRGTIHFGDSTQVLDANGKYIIPGLWDMHTHYCWSYIYLDPLLIANGITGVREMWGNMPRVKEIRKKTRLGEIIAPDIYTSGSIIDGYPPYFMGSVGVKTPEEAKKAVEQQKAEGVDFIKVLSSLTEECFMAIASTANENNIPFGGHVPDEISIYLTMNAGMVTSEHFLGILEACSSIEDSIMKMSWNKRDKPLVETFKKEKFDSLCNVLALSKMYICPTLVCNRSYGYLNDTIFTNDKRIAYIPYSIKQNWDLRKDYRINNATIEHFELTRKRYHFELDLISKLCAKGVKFLAGTDFLNPYCFPGFSLHDELALLVEGGMPELDALRAATINGAKCMRNESNYGSVEEGKIASLLILNNNPLEDIENTKSIESVILRGEFFDRNALDKMLEEAKQEASKLPYSIWLRNKINTVGLAEAFDSLNIILADSTSKFKCNMYDFNMLGYEFLKVGNVHAAKAIFKKNIELFPKSGYVYDSYAEALIVNGEYDSSIFYYKKSLELAPGNENARIMLDSIVSINNFNTH